jgi:hypothetical protein
VSVCVLSRLEGITNGRRAASKSKSGSGARWAVVVTLGLGKKTVHVRKWTFRYRQRQRRIQFEVYVERFNESTSPDEHTLREFVSWPDRYIHVYTVMCLLRLGSKFAGASRKSSCLLLLLEDNYVLCTFFLCSSRYHSCCLDALVYT